MSEGLHDVDGDGVWERLKALHPSGAGVPLPSEPSFLDPGFGDDEEMEWPKLIERAIASFPPGSASGPSGLRPVHLQDCVKKARAGAPLVDSLV